MRHLIAIGGLCSIVLIGHTTKAAPSDAMERHVKVGMPAHTLGTQDLMLNLAPWTTRARNGLPDFLTWQPSDSAQPQTLDFTAVHVELGFRGSETDKSVAGVIDAIKQIIVGRWGQHGREVVARDSGRGIQTVTYETQENDTDDGQSFAPSGDQRQPPGRRRRHFHLRSYLEDNDGDGQPDDQQSRDADEWDRFAASLQLVVDQQDDWIRRNVDRR